MQRLIAIILFIISFFVPGDMSKANVYPENAITEGSTKAEFVFENKTGNRLDITVKVDSIKRKSIQDENTWIDISYEQHYTDGITQYKLYPNEKTILHVNFVDPVTKADVPLISGDYQITVSYTMSGYTDNETATKTFDFTVEPSDW